MRLTTKQTQINPVILSKTQEFYDLEVANTHCYFANDILVSNSHFTLAEKLPRPIFEKAIRMLTGLSSEEFDGLISSKLGLDPTSGKLIKRDPNRTDLLYGGKAFEYLLSKIDRDKELEELLAKVNTLRGEQLDKAVKKIKILRALKKANMQPTVYLSDKVPVLPPVFRPLVVLEDGSISFDDLNGLYKNIALDNKQLQEMPQEMPERERGKLRAELYDGLRALAGLDSSVNKSEKKIRGVMDLIHGSELKYGFFQKYLIKRRQDLSARGVVTPDMDIGLNEVGIPKSVAKVLYEPFVIRRLGLPPYSMPPRIAKEALEKETESAMRVLESEMAARPLLMKRDPVLFKHGIMAMYPKIVNGSAIRVSPLVTDAYNMDFDGDTASLYVPVTPEAVEDAKRMLPTNILKIPSGKQLAYTPRLESLMGLYILSDVKENTNQTFNNDTEILDAFEAGKINTSDVVYLRGKPTTAGRILLSKAIDSDEWQDKILYDLKLRLDSKTTKQILDSLVPTADKYKTTAEKLSRLGFTSATLHGVSFGIDDFMAVKEIRDKHLQAADIKASHISPKDPNRNKKLFEIYSEAGQKIQEEVEAKLPPEKNMLMLMWKSGAKGNWNNIRQIISTPLLVDTLGGPIPTPIRHSYSEGLDVAEYWIASHGARKSMYDRTQEVSLPGAINKQLIASSMNQVITEKDCGSTEGLLRPVSAPDIIDRVLATPVKLKNATIPPGTIITPKIVAELQHNKIKEVKIRSPLHCKAHKGLCQHCYGLGPDGKLPPIGYAAGVVASQALGERGAQLALRSFHTAGVTTAKGLTSSMERVRQLVNMPEILPDSAVLATTSGRVTKILDHPAGGFSVYVDDAEHYIPYGKTLTIKIGDTVKKGQPLTDNSINPRELLELTDIKHVQQYLLNELDSLYSKEGVNRLHSEVIVRSLTSLAKVTDPGDHPYLLPSDITNVQDIEAWNAEHKGKPVKYEPILKGVDLLPLEQTEDWLARLAYRRPVDTLVRGSAEMWLSNIHGHHPIPGLVYGAEFGKPDKEGGIY